MTTIFAEYAQARLRRLDAAPATIRAYRTALAVLPADYAGRPLHEVAADPDGCEQLLADLKAAGRSASWRGTILTVVRGTLDSAVRQGEIDRHALGDIKVAQAETAPTDMIPISRDQLEHMAAILRDLGITMWLQRGCGLRASEALAIRKADFIAGGTVLRVAGQRAADGTRAALKGKRENAYRDVPVPTWLWSKVAAIDGEIPTASYYTYRARLMYAAKAAGLPASFTSHQLRHQFASALLSDGVSVSAVSKWLGHADVGLTVSVYCHLQAEDWDRGRAALEKL